MLAVSPAKSAAPFIAGPRLILRLILCGLFYLAWCIAFPGIGVAQEGDALAQADQGFQRAVAIWGDGKSSDAEALLKNALAIRREQLGPNDPKVAQVVERLGALAAKAVLREGLRIYEISLPPDHPGVREDEVLLSVAETEAAAPVNFVKVFDISDVGFRDWWFSAFGLIFVVIGIFIALFPNILARLNIPYFNFRLRLGWFRRYVFLGFGLFWTAIAFGSTFSQYMRHKSLVEENRCRVVEGTVQNFSPMLPGGHSLESFTVAGVPFSYSDFVVTDGFNNTASHGGPISKDSYVRICYDPAGNVILRLEIRDFKGTPKNYAKPDGFSGSSGHVQLQVERNPLPVAPWYGNFIVCLYIFDLAAIYALFLPYLRTFFRLKTVTLQNCALPSLPRAGAKIRLRNTLIYRDPDSPTLWLRPRGFNFFQVQQTVAALKMDVSKNSLVAYEIRFSSGTPFILILFFWTAYRFFSTVPAVANAPPPVLFLGLFAVVAVIGGFFLVARNRSRMEKLVEEAVAELRQQR